MKIPSVVSSGEVAPLDTAVASRLALLDRFLPIWIVAAMATGIGLGRAAPGLNTLLNRVQLAGTSLPIALGLLVMMYPVLAKVRYAEMDRVLDAARASGSLDDQAKLYKEMQALSLEDPPGIVPYVINHVNAYRKAVTGFKSSPMMWLDLREVSLG